MSLIFFQGPAGSGKTTRVCAALQQILETHPLEDHQRVLALTKMHGSRRRMDSRLAALPGLNQRFLCSTVDSFAWRIVRRWRSLARLRCDLPLVEEDYEQVCTLAGVLLSERYVRLWVSRAFPVVAIDEMQDSKRAQLRIVQALSASSTCVAAADGFQDLDTTADNEPVVWAQETGVVENLSEIYRTSVSGLLAAAGALRNGRDLPQRGNGFTVLAARNQNDGASFVARNLSWWSRSGDIAILTPVHAATSAFVRNVIARVEARAIGTPPVGPHRVPWEATQEDECDRFIASLSLPTDPAARLAAADVPVVGMASPMHDLRGWFEKQRRVAGRTSFTAEEVRVQARRIYKNLRAYRRTRESGVRAMTIHQAKNREFDSVIVLWPYEVGGSAERRRRLLYNAVTRAVRQALVVVQNPNRLSQPPFVAEVLAEESNSARRQ